MRAVYAEAGQRLRFRSPQNRENEMVKPVDRKPLIITVALTDAQKWPCHGPERSYPVWKNVPKTSGGEHRGKTIRIIADPIPNKDWECDSDVLWPVLPEDSRAFGIRGYDAYVCRHQIQIGD
jgi:hypothetical protein